MDNQEKLKMSGVTKIFPGVRALDNVSISVHRSEILGLVGVNGAGKSTLMNILGGIFQPDAGQITIDGKPVTLAAPKDADAAGIAFIHQELLYFPAMTVAENMFVSHLPSVGMRFIVNRAKTMLKARKYLTMLGSDIQPSTKMEDLSVGEKQVVEIARALASGSDIVIFDEPSSSLSLKEKIGLYAIVKKLKTEGKAIVYISHFLDEIKDLCDSYTVLRNGCLVGSGDVKDVAKSDIVEMIVGGSVGDITQRRREHGNAPLLRVNRIKSGVLLNGVSFTLNKGEILGLWGLMGAGRTELIRAILGLDPMDAGSLELINGDQSQAITPASLLKRTGYVTENRRIDGLFLDEPVWKNISATTLKNFAKGRMKILNKRDEARTAKNYIEMLGIKTPGLHTRTANLSGGNQQKVVFSKWLAMQPEILILDEPTRGVDIRAKKEIGELITNLANEGTAVLLITSEVEEMVTLSDRVLVLRDGVISDEISGGDISETALMGSAMGAHAAHV